jgi:hypothetical protein
MAKKPSINIISEYKDNIYYVIDTYTTNRKIDVLRKTLGIKTKKYVEIENSIPFLVGDVYININMNIKINSVDHKIYVNSINQITEDQFLDKILEANKISV